MQYTSGDGAARPGASRRSAAWVAGIVAARPAQPADALTEDALDDEDPLIRQGLDHTGDDDALRGRRPGGECRGDLGGVARLQAEVELLAEPEGELLGERAGAIGRALRGAGLGEPAETHEDAEVALDGLGDPGAVQSALGVAPPSRLTRLDPQPAAAGRAAATEEHLQVKPA